jgi:hypothetical protein
MKKRGFKSWVFNRIETQRKLTVAAALGMASVGLVLFLIEAGITYLLFKVLYSPRTGFLVVTGIFGVMGLYSWELAKKDLRDRRHKTLHNNEKVILNVVPATSQVWSWAFGSMEPDRSIIEKLIGVAMIVPRLFCAAWHTWHRLEDIRRIDSDTTLSVMKILFRNDHSVTAQKLADGLGDVGLNKAIRDVSLLDGVVFLTNNGISLSIAPRLSENLEDWRSDDSQKADNNDLFVQ